MQWEDCAQAGFSEVTPWFCVNPNYMKINVSAQEKDPDSILNFYRKCLALRKESETLLWGSYREFFPKDKQIYMYERAYKNVRYLIICSFSNKPVHPQKPQEYRGKKGKLVLCNYPKATPGNSKRLPESPGSGWFAPYEARVYRFEDV